MPIPYVLAPNEFTEKGGYFARMRSAGRANLEMIADRIVARGSTVGKADVLAVLYLLIQVCIDLILEGWRVHLGGLVKLYCNIEGIFDTYDDAFDPHRHTLKGMAQPGLQLNEALQNRGQLRRQESRRQNPNPQRFTDVISGAHDSLTPGGMGRLVGSRLKFDPTAEDEGPFFDRRRRRSASPAGGSQHRQLTHLQPAPPIARRLSPGSEGARSKCLDRARRQTRSTVERDAMNA